MQDFCTGRPWSTVRREPDRSGSAFVGRGPSGGRGVGGGGGTEAAAPMVG